jgi:capsular polysaccharide biosynthesis protein
MYMPKDLTPQKILNMLLRHVKLILLITALVTLIVYGYSRFFITPVYSSSSLILIHNYDERTVTQATSYYNDGRVKLNDINASAQLASTCVVLFNNMPDMTALMSGASVSISQVEDSAFIRFTASSSNPQQAANVANQLAAQSAKTFADYFDNEGRVDTISGASPASVPSSPNINQNTIFGLAIGFVLGVLLAFFLEIIDTTLKPGDDLAKMYGLPVFAEIVDFEKEG